MKRATNKGETNSNGGTSDVKALILADIHYAEWHRWQAFLECDPARFDIIVCLGDIDIMYLESIQKTFAGKPIVGVHGNHDHHGDLPHFGITDLHGKIASFRGVRFAGVEGCVRYKAGVAPIHEQEAITVLLESMPAADVVIAHNSPKGIHDRVDIAHEGYEGLRSYIQEHAPRYVFHGHQHVSRRSRVDETDVLGVYGGIIFDMHTGLFEQVLTLED